MEAHLPGPHSLQRQAWHPKPEGPLYLQDQVWGDWSRLVLGWLSSQCSPVHHLLLFPDILPVTSCMFMHPSIYTSASHQNHTTRPSIGPSKKFSPLKTLSFDGNPAAGISQPVWQTAELTGNILCISAKKHCGTLLTASICQRSRCFTKTNCSKGEESGNNRDLGAVSGLV